MASSCDTVVRWNLTALKCDPTSLFERPLAEHAIGLAATARTAEENLFRRALDERVLWARLRRPGPMIWLAHASPGLHELLLPLLGAHRLVANAVHGLDLHSVAEQPKVLAERHQRSMLVVHLHAQRAVCLLAHLGNRVERRLLELRPRHDRHPRHQD